MRTREKRQGARMLLGLAILALVSYSEIPQDAPKPYAGKEDTKPYAGDLFKGDKAKYEKTLADRAGYQDERARPNWK